MRKLSLFAALMLISVSLSAVPFTDSLGRTAELPEKIEKVSPSGNLAQLVLYSIDPGKIAGWSSRLSGSAAEYFVQDVVNLANLSSIRAGNPQLVPSYINDLSARYIYTNQKMGSTLSVNASYSSSSDYVSDSLVVNSPDFEVTDGVLLGEGNQFIKPVNMKGYRRLTGAVTYGVPLKFLRSNLSITASASASRLPSMVNETYAPIKKRLVQCRGQADEQHQRKG